MYSDSDLVAMFCDQHLSLSDICAKTCLEKDVARTMLIKSLGEVGFRHAARRNGGYIMFRNLLRSQDAYDNYRARMSRAVSGTLETLMSDDRFRDRWVKKAKLGSKKGLVVLKQMLSNNTFLRSWIKKCRVGGNRVLREHRGIHAPEVKHLRAAWSLSGLRRTGRKVKGPAGEVMYNSLEVAVARHLLAQGLKYSYEVFVPASNTNGYVSIDFVLEGNVFIEATYWDDVEEKSSKLQEKYRLLKSRFGSISLIVVTIPKLVEVYRRFLGTDIKVCSLNELSKVLQFIAG